MRYVVALATMSVACRAFAGEMNMGDAMQMTDDARFGMLKFDQLEHAFAPGNNVAWDADAWYGGDFDKIWLRSEGARANGRLDARTELFWDHAFASFWDWQIGARHDSGLGATRDWAAFGVRGLAPYGFEMEATAYVSDQGRTALRWRTEYELLITQQLVLQPEFETNFYARSDRARDIASGLSDVQFGLRLRYEIRREFAPYVGVVWMRRFADLARDDAQIVAGVRFWF